MVFNSIEKEQICNLIVNKNYHIKKIIQKYNDNLINMSYKKQYQIIYKLAQEYNIKDTLVYNGKMYSYC